MEPIPLETGMRVRCIDASSHTAIVEGETYVVRRAATHARVYIEGFTGGFYPYRFKPIIRVKMRAMPSLDILLARALRTFDKMSPAEKDAHIRAQRAPMALARNMD
jgi:hypothetical protein